MKKNKAAKYLGVFIAVLLGAQSALATEVGKFYIGADLGSTEFSGDGPGESIVFVSGQKFNDLSSSYGAHAGFQFSDWFAIELGYTDFGSAIDYFKTNPDIAFIVSPNTIQAVDAKGASLAGIFSYDLGADFTVFGALGVTAIEYENTLAGGFSPSTGSLHTNSNFSDHGLLYGLGAKYKLNNSFNLRTDLRRNDVGDFTLDTASLGIEYSF